MSKTLKDSLIVGFALFAVFFGAGNLIFPPAIGLAAGEKWPIALVTLILAAILLPIMAVISVSKCGGSFEELTRPVGKWFFVGFNLLVMIGVGVFANIPRTAATTYEMAIAPFFPSVPIQLVSVIYFAIVCYFAIDKSGFVDKVGKILTPLLLLILTVIVVKGIIVPLGTPQTANVKGIFSFTFLELYFSGDLLTGLLCTPIFVAAVRAKGYTKEQETRKITFNAAIIAAIGFFVVYGGLLVIAAGTGSLFPADIGRTALLSGIVKRLLGNAGIIGLAIAVMLACLSTAIGLTAAVADFISSLTNGKISYKLFVIVSCVIGAGIGIMGVDNIISFAGPIFFLVYPSAILLTFLGLFRSFVPNIYAYRYSVIVTLAFSALQSLQILGVNNPVINNIVSSMPFVDYGLAWIVPACVGFVLGMVINKFAKKQSAE